MFLKYLHAATLCELLFDFVSCISEVLLPNCFCGTPPELTGQDGSTESKQN